MTNGLIDENDVCEVICGIHAETLGLYVRGIWGADLTLDAFQRYAKIRDIETTGKVVECDQWRNIPAKQDGELVSLFKRNQYGRGAFWVMHMELRPWQ